MRKLVHGWKKDKPDPRDRKMLLQRSPTYPLAVDLRALMPPVYDQGQIGSCTANAIAAAIQYEMKKNNQPSFMPSRLYIYYNERNLEGSPGDDSGAEIRDGFTVINAQGVAPEPDWPYDESKFAIEPPASVYVAATHAFVTGYYRVDQAENSIKLALAAGMPVVFGFNCYDAFESDEVEKSGVLELPAASESPVGGHAVLCVGYTSDGYWIVRNSWGTGWGLQGSGYFKMAKAYMLDPDLASDFWVAAVTYTGA